MIKIIPTGYSHVFQLEIYTWSNHEQKHILTGNYEICCHAEDGKFHSKDLMQKEEGKCPPECNCFETSEQECPKRKENTTP
jgi:hypothetical protein